MFAPASKGRRPGPAAVAPHGTVPVTMVAGRDSARSHWYRLGESVHRSGAGRLPAPLALGAVSSKRGVGAGARAGRREDAARALAGQVMRRSPGPAKAGRRGEIGRAQQRTMGQGRRGSAARKMRWESTTEEPPRRGARGLRSCSAQRVRAVDVGKRHWGSTWDWVLPLQRWRPICLARMIAARARKRPRRKAVTQPRRHEDLREYLRGHGTMRQEALSMRRPPGRPFNPCESKL